jgi:hypothetical protein
MRGITLNLSQIRVALCATETILGLEGGDGG